jgi:hypothetical protein
MIYQFRKATTDTPTKKGNSSIISTHLDNEEEGDLKSQVCYPKRDIKLRPEELIRGEKERI